MEPCAPCRLTWPVCAPDVCTTMRWIGIPGVAHGPPGDAGVHAVKATVAGCVSQPAPFATGDTVTVVCGGSGATPSTLNASVFDTTVNDVRPVTDATLALVPGT